jgi:hypothetical protein
MRGLARRETAETILKGGKEMKFYRVRICVDEGERYIRPPVYRSIYYGGAKAMLAGAEAAKEKGHVSVRCQVQVGPGHWEEYDTADLWQSAFVHTGQEQTA